MPKEITRRISTIKDINLDQNDFNSEQITQLQDSFAMVRANAEEILYKAANSLISFFPKFKEPLHQYGEIQVNRVRWLNQPERLLGPIGEKTFKSVKYIRSENEKWGISAFYTGIYRNRGVPDLYFGAIRAEVYLTISKLFGLRKKIMGSILVSIYIYGEWTNMEGDRRAVRSADLDLIAYEPVYDIYFEPTSREDWYYRNRDQYKDVKPRDVGLRELSRRRRQGETESLLWSLFSMLSRISKNSPKYLKLIDPMRVNLNDKCMVWSDFTLDYVYRGR